MVSVLEVWGAARHPAGRPDFPHGAQMDFKRSPWPKSEIFLQGKTAILKKVFLRGRPCKNTFSKTAVFP